MNSEDNNRKNYGLVYYSIGFLAAFFFEFYWILTNPYEYFMILGIGAIMLVTGFLTIDSLLKIRNDRLNEQREHNETMLKAQKAIYIATKKNAANSQSTQQQTVKAVEMLVNNMIASQNKLLDSKKAEDSNDISSLVEKLTESNARLAKELQSVITVNDLVKSNAELAKNVREVLISRNCASQETVSEKPVINETVINKPVVSEPIIDKPVVNEPVINKPVINEPVEPCDSDVIFEFEDAETSEDIDTEIDNEINMKKMEESEALEDMTIPEEMTPELDSQMSDINPDTYADMLSDISDNMASEVAVDTDTEDIAVDTGTEDVVIDTDTEDVVIDTGTEDVVIDTGTEDVAVDENPHADIPASSEDCADVDSYTSDENDNESSTLKNMDDDPNRQLSEEEIAALFASL